MRPTGSKTTQFCLDEHKRLQKSNILSGLQGVRREWTDAWAGRLFCRNSMIDSKAEHESGLPAAHYRYTRGKTCGYGTCGSESPVITGLHRSGCMFWVLQVPATSTCKINFFT